MVEQHLSLSLAQSESVYPSNTSLWPYVMPNVAVPLTYRKTPLAASQCAGIGVDMTRKPVNRLCDVRPGAHHQIHQTTFKCTVACRILKWLLLHLVHRRRTQRCQIGLHRDHTPGLASASPNVCTTSIVYRFCDIFTTPIDSSRRTLMPDAPSPPPDRVH